MSTKNKFLERISLLPPPGGNGCHVALLGAANLGAKSGYSQEEVFQRIREAIPKGNRHVPGKEIWDAVRKAFCESNYSKSKDFRIMNDLNVNTTNPTPVEELMRMSPLKIPEKVDTHAVFLLENLYMSDDIIFLGERYSSRVRAVGDWIPDRNLTQCPLIIPNPLTGRLGKTKDNKESYRADSCVMDYKFVVAEFDTMSIELQVGFWIKLICEGLPVAAVIHSGGKSLHAWISVNCADVNEWETEVESNLFPNYLVPLGIDGACKNESRMSRLPGHFRKEKGQYQKLLYFNPNA